MSTYEKVVITGDILFAAYNAGMYAKTYQPWRLGLAVTFALLAVTFAIQAVAS